MNTMTQTATLSLLLLSTGLQAQSPDSPFIGYWMTEDKKNVISIEQCEKKQTEICGYIMQFESTGNAEYDAAICRYPLVRGLTEKEGKLHHGTFTDLEGQAEYNVTVLPIDGQLAFNIFAEKETEYEQLLWNKTTTKLKPCDKPIL